jgi:hypothetical protein
MPDMFDCPESRKRGTSVFAADIPDTRQQVLIAAIFTNLKHPIGSFLIKVSLLHLF